MVHPGRGALYEGIGKRIVSKEAKELKIRSAEHKSRPFIQPLALAAVCLVLVCLFFIMGLMDLNRLEKTLLDMLERRAISIVQDVERVAQHGIDHLRFIDRATRVANSSAGLPLAEEVFSIHESLASALIDLARDTDFREEKRLTSREELPELAAVKKLRAITLLDDKGRVIFQTRPVPMSLLSQAEGLFAGREEITIDLFKPDGAQETVGFIAIRRRSGGGVIALFLDKEGLSYWGLRVAIQRAIEETGEREEVAYFAVTDQDNLLLAWAGELPEKWEASNIPIQEAFSRKTPRASTKIDSNGSNLLEMIAPFRLNGQIVGVARLGLKTGTMDQLLDKNRMHILFSVVLMVGIGLFSMWLLYRNQNRHLSKMQEMADRLHQAERLSALGQLAAGVAHEVRNPLNAISMAAQRLEREYLPDEKEKRGELLRFTGVIRDQSRRLNAIIEEFLTFSQSRRLEFRPYSIIELLQRIVWLFKEEVNSRGITIETRWKDFPNILPMDVDKMQQALINLVKNSMESISAKGTITISAEPQGKGWVRVKVADTGAGILPGEIDRIFNPSYTTKEKGLGLGLAIAHEIVHGHGGEIRVQSDRDRGTTFEILLPAEGRRN